MTTITGGLNNWWNLEYHIDSANTKFNLTFNPMSVKKMSVVEAADYTAKMIASNYSNFYLLMSGGLDSEFVADALYRNQVPFTPVVGYVSGSENQDYFFALNWCHHKKITPLTIEFGMDDIRLQTACAKVCHNFKIKTSAFLLAAIIEEVKKLNGTLLTGETNLTKEDRSDCWDEPVGDILELEINGMFGSIYTNGVYPCEFMLYTPELTLALISNLDTSINNARAKTKLYNVPFRPKTWPPRMLSPEIKDKIYKICKMENIPTHVCQTWNKKDLIDILSKAK